MYIFIHLDILEIQEIIGVAEKEAAEEVKTFAQSTTHKLNMYDFCDLYAIIYL